MRTPYLLDTNAYYNYLYMSTQTSINKAFSFDSHTIEAIKHGNNYISALTRIEIISVIGKHARGGKGELKKWNNRLTDVWLKIVKESLEGSSAILNVTTLPLTNSEILEAQSIIKLALVHNFGSVDAVIAATAKVFNERNGGGGITIVTSDKGLKACLAKCALPCVDAFSAD